MHTTNKSWKPIFPHRNFQQQPFAFSRGTGTPSCRDEELFKVPTACSCGRYCILLSVKVFVLRNRQRTIGSLWQHVAQMKWCDLTGTSVQRKRCTECIDPTNLSGSNQRRNNCLTTSVKSSWNAAGWFYCSGERGMWPLHWWHQSRHLQSESQPAEGCS